MTDGNTVIGTSSLLDHGLKHNGPVTSEQLPDESFMISPDEIEMEHVEEKMMEELVTSEDETTDKLVMTMALVHSVVDHNKKREATSSTTAREKSKVSESARLRKRRRPSCRGDETRKKVKSEEQGGSVVTEEEQHPNVSTGDSGAKVGDSSGSCDTSRENPIQPQDVPIPGPLIPPLKPQVVSVPSVSVSSSPRTSSNNLEHQIDPPAIVSLPPNSSVPNPLSNPLPGSSGTSSVTTGGTSAVHFNETAETQTSQPTTFPVTVPCPLPVSTFENHDGEESQTQAPAPTMESIPDKRKVVISTEPPAETRGRVFSIDLDPSFLDSMVTPQEGSGSASVTDLPMILGSGNGRDRAFSFECFAFGINADEPLPPLQDQDGNSIATRPRGDSIVSYRPRGDSIISDRPRGDSIVSIRPRSDSVMSNRPRGDSIIFDPVSFQDGGIHEKTATLLATARSRGLSVELDESAIAIVSTADEIDKDVEPTLTLSISANETTPPLHDVDSQVPEPCLATSSSPPQSTASSATGSTSSPMNMTTLPSSLNGTITATSTSGATATFSMELLNKEGRIGIYLPEARKARIARFHAKRKMRIWRKRIKYDCRKKLADSRPRIKGRFVKRSDMGDD